MRVFDFEGVVEGLNELIDELEGKQIPKNTIRDSQEEEEEVMLLEEAENSKKEKKEECQSAGMVLINNLSQVLGLLLKDNYAKGMLFYCGDKGKCLRENHRSSYPNDTGSKIEEYGTRAQSLCYLVELECLVWKRSRACLYL
jgi:hypothetical protein